MIWVTGDILIEVCDIYSGPKSILISNRSKYRVVRTDFNVIWLVYSIATLDNQVIIFFVIITLKLNILLNVYYVQSDLNDADSPSRFSSDIDGSLSDLTWDLVEASFGPHSVDWMAIPSNVKRSRDGEKLKFSHHTPIKSLLG